MTGPNGTLPVGRRIVIVGSYGAGKSTLARRLGPRLGIPVHHLDASRWTDAWTLRPREAWLRHVDEILASESWIIDGNFEHTLDRRLARCDTAIFLDYPLLPCAWRVVRRRRMNVQRDDLPEGLRERQNLHLLRLFWEYRRTGRATIERQLAEAAARGVTVLAVRDAQDLERAGLSFG